MCRFFDGFRTWVPDLDGMVGTLCHEKRTPKRTHRLHAEVTRNRLACWRIMDTAMMRYPPDSAMALLNRAAIF